MNIKKSISVFQVLVGTSVIVIFVYSSILKIKDIDSFFITLEKSPIVPKSFISYLGWAVPILEIFIAFLFVFNIKYAFLMSFFLFTSFSIYIYLMTNHIHYVPCGCGGFIEELSWIQHLYLNIFMAVSSLICYLLPHTQKQNNV